MKIDLSHFQQTFLQESADHVSSMETGLLALRSAPADVELLNAIFRSAHSIKGGAGSFGFTNLVRFTHCLETLLDRLRSSEMQADDDVIDALIRSVDVVSQLLQSEASAAMPPEGALLMEHMDAFGSSTQAAEPAEPQVESPAAQEELTFYKVGFKPARELFDSGTNPILLLRNLADLGSVSCIHLDCGEIPGLAELDPGQCYLSWTVELISSRPESELREVFEFVEHLAEVTIVRQDLPGTDAASTKEAEPASVPAVSVSPAPEVVAPVAAPAPVRAASAPKKADAPKKGDTGAESIRVPIQKVDRLIDLVGELVIAQVSVARMVKDDFDATDLPALRDAVAAMERNTRELHERVMGVRMLPVGMLFQRYPRTVYDICQITGKQISVELHGEETEIDRSMLESISDPLIHLVRNAADHGIENPEERRAAGKPEQGVLSLKAFHHSGRVVIEVSDDGAGIDVERVRRKAIERGLIAADAVMTDDQIRMLIFQPGFSTRDQVSDLSGRGVGMDVVKRNVSALNGDLKLSSEKGHGTTVRIELPLTLAIMDGLLVRVGERTLVAPVLSVRETVALQEEKVVRLAEQAEVVVLRGESIPLLRLSRFLGLMENAANSDEAQGEFARKLVVIVEAGQQTIGLVVDELLGQQQVVVKSLERHFRKVSGLMGATILPDSSVAPILDISGLSALDLYSLQTSLATTSTHLN